MSGSTISAGHLYKPSNARLVVIDGFTPVPRGAAATPPVMPSWPVKDPADLLDYTVDVSAVVAGDGGDDIAAVSVAISPSNTGDAAATSVATDGLLIVLWIGSGYSGTLYTVTLTITLASGRILSRSITLPVYSLSSAATNVSNLTTELGAVITDEGTNPIVVGN